MSRSNDIHSRNAVNAGYGHYLMYGCCGFVWCATCGVEVTETSPTSTEAEERGFVFLSASELLGAKDGAWFCPQHIEARVVNYPIMYGVQ